MYNPESDLANEALKILWDSEIKTDHLIPVKRQNLVIIYKKETLPSSRLYHSNRPQIENKKSEKKDKYFDLARKLQKLWNIRLTVIPAVFGALGMVLKGLAKEAC